METETSDFIDDKKVQYSLLPVNPYLYSSSASSSSSSSEDDKNRYKLSQLAAKYLKKRKRHRRVTPTKPCKKGQINIIYSDSSDDDFSNQPRTSTPIKKDSQVVRKLNIIDSDDSDEEIFIAKKVKVSDEIITISSESVIDISSDCNVSNISHPSVNEEIPTNETRKGIK